jgi:hypothetical protein
MSQNSSEIVETPISEVPAVVVPETPAPVEQPVAPVVTEPEEKTYMYQPTDDEDRPLGGKQVIKYRTEAELIEKMRKQNTELIRKLREVTKKQRLGISETEAIPDEAVRFDTPIEFTPRDLSPDERVQLSRDLLDPEKFGEASSTLFEATVGAKPEVLRNTLTRLQVNDLRIMAKNESDAFVAANPDYHKCQENFETITNWMLKYNLKPVRENFQLAYDRLKEAGLLLSAPKVREEAPAAPPLEPVIPAPAVTAPAVVTPANTQPVEDQPSRITTEEPPQAKRPVVAIPTGLTRNQGSDAIPVRPIGDEIVYEHIVRDGTGKPTGETKVYTGLAAIERMPSDEYKRRVNHDKNFQQKVEKLLTEPSRK